MQLCMIKIVFYIREVTNFAEQSCLIKLGEVFNFAKQKGK